MSNAVDMTKQREQAKNSQAGSKLDRFAMKATQSVGSVPSLVFHTFFFVGIFSLQWLGFSIEQILLILTTLVSLEAIYLAIFIQMSVNRQAIGLSEVRQDIEEISEDVEEISEDIEDIQEDVKELSEDVEEISDDIEEDDHEDAREHRETTLKLQKIEDTLHQLLKDIDEMKKK
jgi:cell division protein FtsL